MSRPPLVLVTGTGTEVGKTWVAVHLLAALRDAGTSVAVRKLAQSFDSDEPPSAHDASILAAATGEHPSTVCPPHRSYPVPMAPPMAAEVLGAEPFTIAELAAALAWPVGAEVGVVESAGGVRSPQAADGDVVDLWRALSPCLVVLVADAGLGTIHAVRSSAASFLETPEADGGRGSGPLVVVLNRFDRRSELHRRNHRWLADRDGFDVVCLPGHEHALVGRVRAACGLSGPEVGKLTGPGGRPPDRWRTSPPG